jgi:cytochrome b subunit of formate dehydrogenase
MSTPSKKSTAPSGSRPLIFRVALRDAVDATARLRTDHRGGRYVNRFSIANAIEHFVFLLAFTALGITGFTQTFYDTAIGGQILVLFGGIDAVRLVHHAFAFILAFAVVYHVLNYLNEAFVYRRTGGMWFDKIDLSLLFKLGRTDKTPRFGRYTFSEKVSYWVIAFCILILGFTGLTQMFPIWAARFLPGTIVLFARLFHRWEAVLGVVTVLVWHLYDVVFRKFNLSIFTGNMSIKNMEEDHPLELQYLENAASVVHSPTWPVTIEIPQEIVSPVEVEQAHPIETPEVEEQPAGPKQEAPESAPDQNSVKEDI